MSMNGPSSSSKIAAVTLTFWVAKVVATTLGETAGDFIAHTLGLGYVSGLLVTGAILCVVLLAQVGARTYNPGLFWAAIVGTTTAGTEISDLMDRTLGLGYVLGSTVLSIGLLITLAAWHLRRGTISVDPIADRESETFFWVAVLFSNSLGTAFGDALVDAVGLSYAQGAAICATVIAVVLLLHYLTSINAAILFWAAFVFTRPFGATFGDFLTKKHEAGGLELGTLQTSLAVAALLTVVVTLGLWFERPRRLARGEAL